MATPPQNKAYGLPPNTKGIFLGCDEKGRPLFDDGEAHYQRIVELMNNVLYAGYISIEKWDFALQPAKHEALISLETFQKIQNRLTIQSKAPMREDIRDDFPLRGFVTCDCCGHPMTSCWSKGRNTKYAYYMCFQKGCENYRKSIRKEAIESAFEDLLQKLHPSENLVYMVADMFQDL